MDQSARTGRAAPPERPAPPPSPEPSEPPLTGRAPAKGSAFEAWRTWRDRQGPAAVVAAATLAANARNVQPWLFEIADNQVHVFADPSRAQGALDPFDREMHVGLGCALENLVLAARAEGFEPRVRLLPTPADQTHIASVRLVQGTREISELYAAIPERRTNRGPFLRRPVQEPLLEEIARIGEADLPETRLLWFVTEEQRRRVGDLLVAATEEIVADEDQSRAGHVWFRKTRNEIEHHRDGMTIDTQGLPRVVASVAKILPGQSRRSADGFWVRRTRSVHVPTAAAYGMIIVPDAHEPTGRVRGGRLLQRIHLFATARGLALGHLNMMTVRADRERQTGAEPRFTEALAGLVGEPGWAALVMFRIGYPVRRGSASPRRLLSDVVR